jgi:hypothetical protein
MTVVRAAAIVLAFPRMLALAVMLALPRVLAFAEAPVFLGAVVLTAPVSRIAAAMRIGVATVLFAVLPAVAPSRTTTMARLGAVIRLGTMNGPRAAIIL